jgi:hypothetical protein
MPGTFNGVYKLTLMASASARDSARNDLSLLGHEALKTFLIFIVNIDILCIAESARSFFSL